MNWKTTIFGIFGIIGGISLIITGHTTEGVATILPSLGLVAAKDHNK